MSLLVLSRIIKVEYSFSGDVSHSTNKLMSYRLIDTETRCTKDVDKAHLLAGLNQGIKIANAKLIKDRHGNPLEIAIKSKYDIGKFAEIDYYSEFAAFGNNDFMLLDLDNSYAVVSNTLGRCMPISIEELKKYISEDRIINYIKSTNKFLGVTKKDSALHENELKHLKYRERVAVMSSDADDFEISNLNGRITITRYIGSSDFVRIPDHVEVLGPNIFFMAEREGTKIRKVVLGKSVVEVQTACFSYSSVKSITFNDKLEKIGTRAFNNCKELTELVLPDSVRDIDEYVIEDSAIKSLTYKSHRDDLNIRQTAFRSEGVKFYFSKEVVIALIKSNIDYTGRKIINSSDIVIE